jgi:FAD/FMN-containing dehydrogenase
MCRHRWHGPGMADEIELFLPGTRGYESATEPHNAITAQHPAAVARPESADEVAAAIRTAAQHGRTVVPQATGHGAGAAIGDDVLLLDTRGLDALSIDPVARIARAGAGRTWGRINGEAERHGLGRCDRRRRPGGGHQHLRTAGAAR